ncbi:MAG: DUF1540 domain-containing protein [Actinomycetia bacterium]|nr:DUF1540 domain-containing protein [Actinomycetes bacterium]
MASIRCEVTFCRFNGGRRCTLGEIRISPAPIPGGATLLGTSAAAYDGQLRAGYATEFESYADWARDQVKTWEDGAACFSFSPR